MEVDTEGPTPEPADASAQVLDKPVEEVKVKLEETAEEKPKDSEIKVDCVQAGENSVEDFVPPDDPENWSVSCMHQIEMAALDEVEALEERIFQASLQAKVKLYK